MFAKEMEIRAIHKYLPAQRRLVVHLAASDRRNFICQQMADAAGGIKKCRRKAPFNLALRLI
jgi:hypothetical protein